MKCPVCERGNIKQEDSTCDRCGVAVPATAVPEILFPHRHMGYGPTPDRTSAMTDYARTKEDKQ
jgi:hypothetical protein